MSLEVIGVTSKARALAAEIRRRRQAKPDNDAALAQIDAELNTARGTYMPAKLLGQLSYLASMLDRADQRPGKDAEIRLGELRAWLARLQKEFAKLD